MGVAEPAMYSISVVGAEKRASKHVRQPVHLSAGHTSSIYSQSFAKPQPAILVGGGWPARGVRSVQDLVSLIQDKVHQKSKSLRTEFRRFDKDFSGTVSRREFRLGLAQMGIACADDEFERLLAVVDQDSGGSIDYGEFAAKLKAADAQTHNFFGDSSRRHELQGAQRWGTTSCAQALSQGPSTHMSVEMCDIDSHEDDSGKTMVVPLSLEATQVPS